MINSKTSEWTSVVDSFQFHCTKTPDQCALLHDEASVSYAQLDALSDAFASKILACNPDAGQSVALYCERSVNVVAAMLGCLKSGVAFVPVDPSFPDERVRFILADASVGLVLTDDVFQSKAVALTANSAAEVLLVEAISKNDLSRCSESFPRASQNNRAYIMYTSGSTGKPKGVPISHKALNCYCQADAQVYQLSAADRTLQFSTLSFDISIEEIFPPLTTGGTVVLRPSLRGDAQIELSDIIERYSITAIHLATGYWHEWVDLMSASNSVVPAVLRLMVVTGEKVSPDHYVRWEGLCRHCVFWANAYGPTEATVSATVFIPPDGWRGKTVPIGKVLPGYYAYILDDQLEPVKSGQTGELYIGGDALAEGYLNQPELTAKAFIEDPFNSPQTVDPALARNSSQAPRLYRTGDLARWLSDENIEYAGRIDYQLKIGSYRIEPGEIENTINDLVDVQDSLVTVATDDGRNFLVAYVAIRQQIEEPSRKAYAIKLELERRLPLYMVPSHYVFMSHMPKTRNGKIDREALPAAFTAVLARQSDVTEATTDTEQVLCDIWRDVFGISIVGIHDSFLSLGGDSLMAVKVISGIQRQLQFSISSRDFFFLDTVALLAAHMEGRQVPRLVPPVDAFFINKGQRQTYAVLQSPEVANGLGILLVPPFGNEQRRCQRPFRGMMQTLARDGYQLLRFDWQGTGNSSGNSSDLRELSPWIDDLQEAALKLSESVDEIHLVSVRTGALISALQPLSNLPIAASYHWDPVLNGERWLEEMRGLQRGIRADTYAFLFKRSPRRDALHEFAGFTIQPELYQEIQALDFFDILGSRPSTYPVHLMMSDELVERNPIPADVHVHGACDVNDWVDPRTLTHDMKINVAAKRLVSLMQTSLNKT